MIPNASTSPESTRAITSWSVGVTDGKPRRAASGSHRGPCDGTRFHRGFPLEHRHAHRRKTRLRMEGTYEIAHWSRHRDPIADRLVLLYGPEPRRAADGSDGSALDGCAAQRRTERQCVYRSYRCFDHDRHDRRRGEPT